ncbi:hypothetical protein GCM10010124_30210 [Pilimelia terevasa]|uniref:Gram-positive cocci surface proteins LPxTG domain-containing protein n=1 Tax=Pilimelia terevasa TaxID=53372 RepID=A0A8J3FKX4_9ACTN|nr:hypothetical protein [Pilimelia terevasa]GGK35491.1 hypothetical protein GCM10010124_30210 [Pilimelia terevasa]
MRRTTLRRTTAVRRAILHRTALRRAAALGGVATLLLTAAPAAAARRGPTVTVSGHIWLDRDRDGHRDAREPGVAGIPVGVVSFADVSAGGLVDLPQRAASTFVMRQYAAMDPGEAELRVYLTRTDATGAYQFDGVAAGPLFVEVFTGQPADGHFAPKWRLTRPDRGGEDGDSDFVRYGQDGLVGQVYHDAADGAVIRADGGFLPSPLPATGSLPVTGASLGAVLAAGTGAVLAGLAVLLVGRRRRA